MTRAQVPPSSNATPTGRRRSRLAIAAPAVLALVLVVGACGGDDDDTADSTTVPTLVTTAPPLITQPTATLPPAVTTAPPSTEVTYVTEGASVMVANASRVDGAAGRLSERLAAVGFQMVEPGNYALGKLDVSRIYYDAAIPASQAVAESLKSAFGGGTIEVVVLPAPPPVATGDIGGAGVLVAMGNDIADKTLEEMQGIAPTATSAPEASDDTATDTGDDTATDTASDTGETTTE